MKKIMRVENVAQVAQNFYAILNERENICV